MQVKILLDEQLIKRAQEITGISSEDEVVREALRALISIHEQAASHDVDEDTQSEMGPQEEVTRSLERSLVENADIWSELAKH
jgi:Arc/MetJ family transcription regulator